MDKKNTLPEFVINQLSNSSIRQHLEELKPLAEKIANHTEIINDIFESAKERKPLIENQIIYLLFGLIDESKQIKISLETIKDLTFDQYLNVISKLFEKLEYFITENRTNLYRPYLLKHLKNSTREIMLNTKVVDIMNTFIKTIWYDDEETPTDDSLA